MSDSLKKYVDESPLNDEEKQELLNALSGIPKNEAGVLAQQFEEDPWLVPYLYVNFAAKKYAISKGDKDAFRRVVENEVDILKDSEEEKKS